MELKRVYYEDGMLLEKDDFLQEQEYHLSHRRIYNAGMYTFGVLSGMDVRIEYRNGKDAKLMVKPGMALLSGGESPNPTTREVVLENLAKIPLDSILADAPEGESVWYLLLGVQELSDSSTKRISELPVFQLSNVLPVDPVVTPALGALIINRQGVVLDLRIQEDFAERLQAKWRLDGTRIPLDLTAENPITIDDRVEELKRAEDSLKKQLIVSSRNIPLILKQGKRIQEDPLLAVLKLEESHLLLEKENGDAEIRINVPEQSITLADYPDAVLDGTTVNLLKVKHSEANADGYEFVIDPNPAASREAVLEYFKGQTGVAFEFLGGAPLNALSPIYSDALSAQLTPHSGTDFKAGEAVMLTDGQIETFQSKVRYEADLPINPEAIIKPGPILELTGGQVVIPWTTGGDTNPVLHMTVRDFYGNELYKSREIGKSDFYKFFVLSGGGFALVTYGDEGQPLKTLRINYYSSWGYLEREIILLASADLKNLGALLLENENVLTYYEDLNTAKTIKFKVFEPAEEDPPTERDLITYTFELNYITAFNRGEDHFSFVYVRYEGDVAYKIGVSSFDAKGNTTGRQVWNEDIDDLDKIAVEVRSDKRLSIAKLYYNPGSVLQLEYFEISDSNGETSVVELAQGDISLLNGGIRYLEGQGMLVTWALTEAGEKTVNVFHKVEADESTKTQSIFTTSSNASLQAELESLVQTPLAEGKLLFAYNDYDYDFSVLDPSGLPADLNAHVKYLIYNGVDNTVSDPETLEELYGTTFLAGTSPISLKDGGFALAYAHMEKYSPDAQGVNTVYVVSLDGLGVLREKLTVDDESYYWGGAQLKELAEGNLVGAFEESREPDDNSGKFFFVQKVATKPIGLAQNNSDSVSQVDVYLKGVVAGFRNLTIGAGYYSLDGSLSIDATGVYLGRAVATDKLLLEPER